MDLEIGFLRYESLSRVINLFFMSCDLRHGPSNTDIKVLRLLTLQCFTEKVRAKVLQFKDTLNF